VLDSWSTQDGVVNGARKAEIKSHFPVIAPATGRHWGFAQPSKSSLCEALIKCKRTHTYTPSLKYIDMDEYIYIQSVLRLF